jgi:anti-sigma B factor antagonist
MDIDVRKQSNTHVIRLKGDLKIGQPAEALKKTLEELLAHNEVRFVMNMQEVNMVDSSGIGVLVRSLTSAKKNGGSLKLVNPSKLTLQTLKMVGLLPLFEVYADESEAVATFA